MIRIGVVVAVLGLSAAGLCWAVGRGGGEVRPRPSPDDPAGNARAKDDKAGEDKPKDDKIKDDKTIPQNPQDASDADAAALARGEASFALDLYGRVAAKAAPDDNLCLSPYGAATMLALATAGARGDSAAGAVKALRLPPPERVPAAFAALRHGLEASAVPRPAFRLGLRVSDAKPDGVRVDAVTAGSPAARADLKEGDVIVGVDGRPVAGAADFANALDVSAAEFTFDLRDVKRQSPKRKVVLGPSGKGPRVPRLHLADALWVQEGFPLRPEFYDAARDGFRAAVNEVDFAAPDDAVKAINQWAARETDNKITQLVGNDAVSADTRLFLTDAVYFEGTWLNRFLPESTKDGDFWVSADKKVTVPMMNKTFAAKFLKQKDLQAMELPYFGSSLVMDVLLPDKKDGLAGLEKSLTEPALAAVLDGLKEKELMVSFPRFKAATSLSLKEPLSAMGMEAAFGPKADFSGLSAAKNLSLGDAVQKTFITVDESGTTAAAVSGVGVVATSASDETFAADHPFLFLIRDTRTNAILFMGRVVQP